MSSSLSVAAPAVISATAAHAQDAAGCPCTGLLMRGTLVSSPRVQRGRRQRESGGRVPRAAGVYALSRQRPGDLQPRRDGQHRHLPLVRRRRGPPLGHRFPGGLARRTGPGGRRAGRATRRAGVAGARRAGAPPRGIPNRAGSAVSLGVADGRMALPSRWHLALFLGVADGRVVHPSRWHPALKLGGAWADARANKASAEVPGQASVRVCSKAGALARGRIAA